MSYRAPPINYNFRGPPPLNAMRPIPPNPATMQRPMGPRPNLPPNQLASRSKLVPQEIEDGEITKPPVTTVFVGSISDRAPDNMIRTLLQRCGNIVAWKRVQGADGKLQAFGFCEFEIPDATLRCMRLLNEWPIADKKLVVKVDDKTKNLLEEYEKSHSADEEEIKREDRLALAALDAVMKEFAAELRRNAPASSKGANQRETFGPISSGPKADEGLDGIVNDEDAKSLISREINRFRETYKDDEVVTEIKPSRDKKEKESSTPAGDKDGDRDRDRDRRRADSADDRGRGERRDRDRERTREREREKDRSGRDRDRDRTRSERDDKEREDRSHRKRTRSRSREGSNKARAERSRSPRKPRDEPQEDPDERYERLRLERQLRDKEQAYQERLKNWEVRERKKIREFERDRQRSEERKSEEKKEARRLREFLEDYDDERDDSKYYRGSALSRRMKEREKEAEADSRDRHKEKEEMEELRKKLEEEGHPDPEQEINKRQNPQQSSTLLLQQNPTIPATSVPVSDHNNHASNRSNSHHQADRKDGDRTEDSSRIRATSNSHQPSSAQPYTDTHTAEASVTSHGSSATHSNTTDTTDGRKKKLTVRDVFNDDEDGAHNDGKRKRPLVPLDYEEDKRKKATTVEDKRAAIKRLIDKIPTDKYDLFSWNMDWSQVDKPLLDSRIKPWVNKKITEYIGEEEPTLTEFICQKVMSQSSAESILTDVAMVLDDEAETFVVKMWRLLVYETEAKKAGLVK